MARDLPTMHSIEVKAQEYPMDAESMKEFVTEESKFAYIAKIRDRMIGCVMCVKKDANLIIVRLSVHPAFQNMGVGRALLSVVSKRGYVDRLEKLRIMIPSYKIDDKDDPDYLGNWLYGNEFKAVGCRDRAYYRYGEHWDGYWFEALL
jgi:GNAT superfamily N-acetyltransferase